MRKELEAKGYQISDEQWNQIVSNLENEIEQDLKKALNAHIFVPEKAYEENMHDLDYKRGMEALKKGMRGGEPAK